MSGKSLMQNLKTIIKKKQEIINSEGAEIVTKLDEIKFEVESSLCKVGFSGKTCKSTIFTRPFNM